MHNAPLLCYLGDDFTGSTDALECLTLAGARTVLFVEPPTPEQMARFGQLDAVGVASTCRSMSPAEMDKFLPPALTALKRLAPRHIHYKVCSTFDSSPTVGSIGKVIDVARDIFPSQYVPLVVGAPQLGRYCLFGNLFVRLGSDGPIYRLDRHPSMSCHPVTPADEADLRLHLARQTDKRIGLVDVLGVSNVETATASLESALRDESEIVLFDVLEESHLATIGQLIDSQGSNKQPLFSVGSSGVDLALGVAWTAQGKLQPQQNWPAPSSVTPLLVASGSCSPVTAEQIAWAVEHGFAEVPLDTAAIVAGKAAERTAIEDTIKHLRSGRSVVIHSCRGVNDPRVAATKVALGGNSAELLGSALGRITYATIVETRLRRLLIAGGDTSGSIARTLGVTALEMVARVAPGAPLCRAHSRDSAIDGLEMNFKGGQIGARDYFGLLSHTSSK